MSNYRKVQDDAGKQDASSDSAEFGARRDAPVMEQALGVAPGFSKVGEAVDRPQYGNVIRPSLEHDEGKGEDDVRPNSDDVLSP